jgi:hypothetical protein
MFVTNILSRILLGKLECNRGQARRGNNSQRRRVLIFTFLGTLPSIFLCDFLICFLRHFDSFFAGRMPLLNIVHLVANDSQERVFEIFRKLERESPNSLSEGETMNDDDNDDDEKIGAFNVHESPFSLNAKTSFALLQSFKELIVHLGTRLAPFSPLLFHLLSLCLRNYLRDSSDPSPSLSHPTELISQEEKEETHEGIMELSEEETEEDEETVAERENVMVEESESEEDDEKEEGLGAEVSESADFVEEVPEITNDLFSKKRQKIVSQTILRMTDLLSKFPYVSQMEFAFSVYLSICRRVLSVHLFLHQDSPSLLLMG